MADVVDTETRSRMMAGIRGRNTKPELALRKELHARGYRYRLHAPDLPGKPDIVLPRHRAVIFVHGCFWHRHPGCSYSTCPKSNEDFWTAKFAKNVERDERARRALLREGWRVALVWECAMRHNAPSEVADCVERWIASEATTADIGRNLAGSEPQ